MRSGFKLGVNVMNLVKIIELDFLMNLYRSYRGFCSVQANSVYFLSLLSTASYFLNNFKADIILYYRGFENLKRPQFIRFLTKVKLR